MPHPSYTFTHAITRAPAISLVDGLRAIDTGTPDIKIFRADHAAYIKKLKSTGATVLELDADEAFPDSTFIEDTALCLPEGVVIMRPGAETRLGEAALMVPVLNRYYDEVLSIEAPGTIEGGDILTTACEILVGLSERTNEEGVNQLRQLVSRWGYSVREVQTPPGVLHFKTDCSVLDENTILATQRLATTGCFDDYTVILTADGEEAAANSIRFNDLVLMPSGFPKTAKKLKDAGYDVREIGNSEAAKLDGGMSCLSLRFSPPQTASRSQ